MEQEMLVTAIAGVAAMGFLWLGLVLIRKMQLDDKDRLDGLLFAVQEKRLTQ